VRIIFSRKGFDSSAGGVPSPIVDGHPISLPIPTRMPSRTSYRDLVDPMHSLVEDLTAGRITADAMCHLDPDLNPKITRKPRALGWRGSLGQVGAAQSHLKNCGVGAGDVFVFWGLFRRAELDVSGRWRFVGACEHRIFGWLQVGEVLPMLPDPEAACAIRPWLTGHPHASAGWSKNNTIYVASPRLVLDGLRTKFPGFGTLTYGRRLTGERAEAVTEWHIPSWLDPTQGGTGMTYHPPARWLGEGVVRAAARGQEFVADVGDRRVTRKWLLQLLEAEN